MSSRFAEPKLIVAIDFGTTFSGVAFVYTDKPDDKVVISEWPGMQNTTSDKVPTEIYYDSSAPGGFRWGFDIEPDVQRHQWFKLLLDPSHNLSTESSSLARRYPSKTELPPSYARDATALVSDYLTALRKFTLEVMRNKLSSWVVDDTPIEYILTVPAVWSDRAKNSTIECARRAGMTTVSCISEPEAAANFTISAMATKILGVGDNFVVCDAGGGTVDLITYKITKLTPLKIEESVIGSGGLCGSTYLNRRFEEFLENRIGKDVMGRMPPWSKAKMIREFDSYIKRDFDSRNKYNIETSFVDKGYITITRNEVHDIFEPVIAEVEALVRNQILDVERSGSTVKAVLLVGGFGASKYLKKRLEQMRGVQMVIQPANAWTAVVRGALHREIQNPIVSHRQARCHFGITYRKEFRDGIDPESNKAWDSFAGIYKCNDHMFWYLKRGQKIADGKAVSMPWIQNRELWHNFCEEIDIYCCDSREAPAYRNATTKCVYKLRAKVPKSKYTRTKSATPGEADKYKLLYKLGMVTDSGIAVFRMMVDDVECGSMSTEYV